MSTHPPLLASLLDLATNWRSFMNMPGRYLLHL
jgi:hypothetical protein